MGIRRAGPQPGFPFLFLLYPSSQHCNSTVVHRALSETQHAHPLAISVLKTYTPVSGFNVKATGTFPHLPNSAQAQDIR